jgi:hypothetical protein
MNIQTWVKQHLHWPKRNIVVILIFLSIILNLSLYFIDEEISKTSHDIEELYDRSINQNINASINLGNVIGYTMVLLDPTKNTSQKITAKRICDYYKSQYNDNLKDSTALKNNINLLKYNRDKKVFSLIDVRTIILIILFSFLLLIYIFQHYDQKKILDKLNKIHDEIKEQKDKTKDRNAEEKEELDIDSMRMYI